MNISRSTGFAPTVAPPTVAPPSVAPAPPAKSPPVASPPAVPDQQEDFDDTDPEEELEETGDWQEEQDPRSQMCESENDEEYVSDGKSSQESAEHRESSVLSGDDPAELEMTALSRTFDCTYRDHRPASTKTETLVHSWIIDLEASWVEDAFSEVDRGCLLEKWKACSPSSVELDSEFPPTASGQKSETPQKLSQEESALRGGCVGLEGGSLTFVHWLYKNKNNVRGLRADKAWKTTSDLVLAWGEGKRSTWCGNATEATSCREKAIKGSKDCVDFILQRTGRSAEAFAVVLLGRDIEVLPTISLPSEVCLTRRVIDLETPKSFKCLPQLTALVRQLLIWTVDAVRDIRSCSGEAARRAPQNLPVAVRRDQWRSITRGSMLSVCRELPVRIQDVGVTTPTRQDFARMCARSTRASTRSQSRAGMPTALPDGSPTAQWRSITRRCMLSVQAPTVPTASKRLRAKRGLAEHIRRETEAFYIGALASSIASTSSTTRAKGRELLAAARERSGERCVYCNVPIIFMSAYGVAKLQRGGSDVAQASKDRLDSKLAYTDPEQVLLICCTRCNIVKMEMPYARLLEFFEEIANDEGGPAQDFSPLTVVERHQLRELRPSQEKKTLNPRVQVGLESSS
ncbi:hypothetical protein HDU88_001945 [Geranomyces variabilis]|nr:hypothetical protein HDU88_001945 [Geranomyces variabilis]